jgi:hypothetical protein
MNDNRYSTSNLLKNKDINFIINIYSYLYIELKLLFSEFPLFDYRSGKSYKELSNFHRINKIGKGLFLKQGFSIYVYKEDREIKNSPFLTVKAASESLKISNKNISNYLDTGLKIKDYYFYSYKQ